MTVRRGMVALGDSITCGRGGAPALGVHPQSWALWLAEALDLPVTNLGTDGARAPDVLRHQLPRLVPPYDLATLHVGANDARSVDFDGGEFEAAVSSVLRGLAAAASRVLVLTIPLDLGRPRAGTDVHVANAVLRRHAAATGAIVCELDDFGGMRLVLPDAVHPTSVGMVEIAERAAGALAVAGVAVARRPSTLAHAQAQSHLPARARYAAWYARQVARDRRRRLIERRRYRHGGLP